MFNVECKAIQRTRQMLSYQTGRVRDSATSLTLRRLQFKLDNISTVMCLVRFCVN